MVWHYDGRTARRRTPRLLPAEDSFTLADELGVEGPFAWTELIARDTMGGEAVYELKGRPGWRLGLGADIPPEIAAHLPHAARYGQWIDRFGLGRSVPVLAVIAFVVGFAILSAPRWIAPYVPTSWERRMGDAMVGDMGKRICRGPGGQAALDALAAKLDPPGAEKIDAYVIDIPMVNAVTLPGGKILVFRGLLADAKSADEVAGVLGHEIGHVRHRDVLAAMLRQMGLSVLLGGIGSDVSGTFNSLLAATYSREAESAADRFALEALGRAGISPGPTAGFFKRLAKGEEKLGRAKLALGYLSSHPMSGARERLFAAGAKERTWAPALDAAQWTALRDICANDHDAAKRRKSNDWF